MIELPLPSTLVESSAPKDNTFVSSDAETNTTKVKKREENRAK